MTATEVREKIIIICKEKLGLDFSSVGPENDHTPIYSKPFRFQPNTHLLLAMEVQKEFSIQFSEDQLIHYGLFSLKNIVDAVLENLDNC